MTLLVLLKSFASRLIFFLHGILSVYLFYVTTSNPTYWLLTTPLALLFFEMIFTFAYRKGKEYKYVWPSGLLYIATIIPIIWKIELQLFNSRLEQLHGTNKTINDNKGTLKVFLLNVNFEISNEEAVKKVCELGLIIGLIIGRWLMPRGPLSRDQLSALLLGYVGNSADIIELFQTFEEPGIIYERDVRIVILAVFTWSILQFVLVSTATLESYTNVAVKRFNEKNLKIGSKNSKETSLRKHDNNNEAADCKSREDENKIKQEALTHQTNFVTVRQSPTIEENLEKTISEQKMKIDEETETEIAEEKMFDKDSGRTVAERKPSINGELGARMSIEESGKRSSQTTNSESRNVKQKKNRIGNLEASVTLKQTKSNDFRTSRRNQNCVPGELFDICVKLLMQDGPFLAIRLYLIIEFKVVSEMHIFFTCKNAMISILLVYRLCILLCYFCDREDDFDVKTAMKHTIKLAVPSNRIQVEEAMKMK